MAEEPKCLKCGEPWGGRQQLSIMPPEALLRHIFQYLESGKSIRPGSMAHYDIGRSLGVVEEKINERGFQFRGD